MKQPLGEATLTEQPWYKAAAAAVDEYLAHSLPAPTEPPTTLSQAMHYAVFGPGKRLRPVLVLVVCSALGGDRSRALPAAAALELVHTYSLVHDDLPAMDDDQIRRGRPTVHVVFGTATAILTGDALLTLAFELLAGDLAERCGARVAAAVSLELSRAAGHGGLIAGQVEDLAAEGRAIDADTLAQIHRAKTGALFVASARSGGLTAGADKKQLAALTAYAEAFGLAFQIVDDILDVTGDAERMGRPRGRDRERGKATFVSVHGLAAARQQVADLVEQALAALTDLAAAGVATDALAALIHFVAARDR